MESERRRRRSSNIELAIEFQLEQATRDFDLDTIVLVDEAGRLVSGFASDLGFAEALARETPRLAAGSHCRLLFARLNQHRGSVRPNQVSACEFRIGGRRLYVAAIGSATTMRDVGVYRSILGIRRILAA